MARASDVLGHAWTIRGRAADCLESQYAYCASLNPNWGCKQVSGQMYQQVPDIDPGVPAPFTPENFVCITEETVKECYCTDRSRVAPNPYGYNCFCA
ncbi:hypothetical protein A1F94_007245 [Pyrenophora tritici-repentis]|nr:hypothetical protein A1F94_007245 [Pyrenophora tritici-repentis]